MSVALPRFVRSSLDAVRYYLAGIWRRGNEVPIFIWAHAIAFKVLVTLLPLILIATGVFGLVLRQENPFDTVAGYLRTFLPPGQSESLVTLLYELQEASSTITIFGGIFLFLTVITLFSALRYIVATAVGDRHSYRSILGGYVFDLRMVVQVGLLFLLSFALTLAVNVVSTESTAVLARIGFDPDVLRRGWRIVLRVVALLVPYMISLLMFMQLFYFIPRPSPPSRSAFFGATVSAVLFELAKNGFALYARYTGTFSRYGGESDAALGGLGGIFGLLIAFVVWVYFSGLVLIVGAMMTGLHEHRHHPPRSRVGRFVRALLAKRRRPRSGEPAAAPPDVPDAGPPEGTNPEVDAGGAEPAARPPDERAAPPAGDGAAVTPAPDSRPASGR